MYKIPQPTKLVQHIRNGLVEEEHSGFVTYVENFDSLKIKNLGRNNEYPFYLRSCAKPLQASLLIDYGLDKEFEMNEQEIALCCASHAGEKIHTEVLEKLMKKFGITEDDLLCGQHAPLAQSRQFEMNKNNEKFSRIHNNCSGKHIMMLGLCKLNNWDTKTYNQLNHPLQQEIIKKISQLCKVKENYPITKDGCTVPIVSMPLQNMVVGFLHLFCNPKYEKIKNAFLNNPYLIGGVSRTDTKIIENSKGIVAKVGAGGLCIVVNIKEKSGFVVKISDCNMAAREIFTIDLINKLGWANIEISHDIKTLDNDTVGQIETFTQIN